MYKCVNKLAPNYLCNMCTPRTLSFDLRDASQKLHLLKPRTDYLKRSFIKKSSRRDQMFVEFSQTGLHSWDMSSSFEKVQVTVTKLKKKKTNPV